MESDTFSAITRPSEGACAVATCDICYVRSVLQLESRVKKHQRSSIDGSVCFQYFARKLAIRVSLRPEEIHVSALQRATPRALPGTGLLSLPYARKLLHRWAL